MKKNFKRSSRLHVSLILAFILVFTTVWNLPVLAEVDSGSDSSNTSSNDSSSSDSSGDNSGDSSSGDSQSSDSSSSDSSSQDSSSSNDSSGSSSSDNSGESSSSNDNSSGSDSVDNTSDSGSDHSASSTSSDSSNNEQEYSQEHASSTDGLLQIEQRIRELENQKETATSTREQYSFELQIKNMEQAKERIENIVDIGHDAEDVASGDVSRVVRNASSTRDLNKEIEVEKYTKSIMASGMDDSSSVKNEINNFIAYGTQTTKELGEGERAGVVNSYLATFDHLPSTAAEWADVIKIANGRWPLETSQSSLDSAIREFEKVYKRTPDMTDNNDDAAVTIMAYGLRPAVRDLDKEKTAIMTFASVYNHDPMDAKDWDIVRAIAYSGATR